MDFSQLAETMLALESTKSRNEMVEVMAWLFKQQPPDEARFSVYLLQGAVAPPHAGIEVGLGEKLVEQAISKAFGYSQKEVQAQYLKSGDLGKVAEKMCSAKRQASLFSEKLTIKKVFQTFYRIATLGGHGSQEAKIGLLAELLNNASPLEAKYIARFPIGRLRLGVGDPTVLDALSFMHKGDKSDREALESAYNKCSDLGLVAESYIRDPESIMKFSMQPLMPVRPALAERLPSPEEIAKRLGKCLVEAKYDGFRLQCHKKGDKVEIFSRRMERMTNMLPEVVSAIRQLKCKDMIFEGEALAYNEQTGEFYPFQQTIQRKRKHGVDEKAAEMPLRLFAFDLLYVDGKDISQEPLHARRKMLEGLIKGSQLIAPSESYITSSADEIEAHFQDFVSRGLEGLMAKDLSAPYTAGARKFAWVKLKRSYRGELSDTVDIAIIGYYAGKGARAQLKFGGVLGAVYDPHTDTFQTIAKVGSGFTEEQMKALEEKLSVIRVKKPNARVRSLMEPTFWVEPKYVITVNADEITRSPQHTCGRDSGDVGYALRFPRMVGDVRTDKRPEDATTVDEIIGMYRSQRRVERNVQEEQ
ncbi:MAG: ATP-dependent DNA ligase [Candidatus Micrarchaeota archaeon]|nr:ATP-dependent DNA ligase [Candidatus Micrarchaeota archaeon]